jgi:hypothetical protein
VISVPVDWIAVSHIVERHATDSSLQSIAPPRQKPSHGRINVIASAHPLLVVRKEIFLLSPFPGFGHFSAVHIYNCSSGVSELQCCSCGVICVRT